MFDKEFKEFIIKLKKSIEDRILQNYFYPHNYKGYTIFGGADKLIRRSDRLYNAVLGKTKEGIEDYRLTSGSYSYVLKIYVPYARLHEKGGVIEITPPMRRLFWAKYFINKNSNPTLARAYKNIALFKSAVKYPARAYFEPTFNTAFNINLPELSKTLKEQIKLAFIK